MQFTRRLHEPIRAGVVTCSIRIWQRLHVKIGGKYRLGEGYEYVIVDSIDEIELADITDELAIESGFDSVEDLMKVARHSSGQNGYLIRFHYVDGNMYE